MSIRGCSAGDQLLCLWTSSIPLEKGAFSQVKWVQDNHTCSLSRTCAGTWAGERLARLFGRRRGRTGLTRRDHHEDREALQQPVLLPGLLVAVWELVCSCCSMCSLNITNLRMDKAHFGDKQNTPVKSVGVFISFSINICNISM